jgi:hypothetical protein
MSGVSRLTSHCRGVEGAAEHVKALHASLPAAHAASKSDVPGLMFNVISTGLAYMAACICGSSWAALATVVAANMLAARLVPHRIREVLMCCRCMSAVEIPLLCSEASQSLFTPQAENGCLSACAGFISPVHAAVVHKRRGISLTLMIANTAASSLSGSFLSETDLKSVLHVTCAAWLDLFLLIESKQPQKWPWSASGCR